MVARGQQFVEVNPNDPYGLKGADKKTVQRVLKQHTNLDPDPRVVQTRLRNMYEATPDDVREKAMFWYPNVHEAAMKAARDGNKTTRQAAGVVAAVSPNMDWERNNIEAFHQIDEISPSGWQAIERSARGRKRTKEASEVLAPFTGLSAAPDRNIMKAHRIWHLGEDPDAVLDRRTAPKTNSFFHNIYEPHKDDYVTVDGRVADMIRDQMAPWTMDRGISSAQLKTGKPTRYENYSGHTLDAAHHMGLLGNQLQAVDWENAKLVEKNWNPTRTKGDPRRGQSYMGRISRQFGGGLT